MPVNCLWPTSKKTIHQWSLFRGVFRATALKTFHTTCFEALGTYLLISTYNVIGLYICPLCIEQGVMAWKCLVSLKVILKLLLYEATQKKNAIHARCDALVVLKKCGHAACFVHWYFLFCIHCGNPLQTACTWPIVFNMTLPKHTKTFIIGGNKPTLYLPYPPSSM